MEPETVERIYGRCRGIATRELRRSGVSVVDADDIAQDLAIAAIQGFRNLEWKSRCLCLNAIAKTRCGAKAVKATVDRQRGKDATGLTIENKMDLRAAICKLPPELQQVVELYYLAGQTLREVARATGRPTSIAAVSSELKLALSLLRCYLESEIGS